MHNPEWPLARRRRAHLVCRLTLRFAACCLAVPLPGCLSYSYVDDNNVRHIVGLVHIEMPAAAAAAENNGAVIQTSAIGLSFQHHPDRGAAVTLGYVRDTLLSLGSGACVDLHNPGPCADIHEK